jgi:hypothetical protein
MKKMMMVIIVAMLAVAGFAEQFGDISAEFDISASQFVSGSVYYVEGYSIPRQMISIEGTVQVAPVFIGGSFESAVNLESMTSAQPIGIRYGTWMGMEVFGVYWKWTHYCQHPAFTWGGSDPSFQYEGVQDWMSLGYSGGKGRPENLWDFWFDVNPELSLIYLSEFAGKPQIGGARDEPYVFVYSFDGSVGLAPFVIGGVVDVGFRFDRAAISEPAYLLAKGYAGLEWRGLYTHYNIAYQGYSDETAMPTRAFGAGTDDGVRQWVSVGFKVELEPRPFLK